MRLYTFGKIPGLWGFRGRTNIGYTCIYICMRIWEQSTRHGHRTWHDPLCPTGVLYWRSFICDNFNLYECTAPCIQYRDVFVWAFHFPRRMTISPFSHHGFSPMVDARANWTHSILWSILSMYIYKYVCVYVFGSNIRHTSTYIIYIGKCTRIYTKWFSITNVTYLIA